MIKFGVCGFSFCKIVFLSIRRNAIPLKIKKSFRSSNKKNLNMQQKNKIVQHKFSLYLFTLLRLQLESLIQSIIFLCEI